MLNFERIELLGFKSFADKVKIDLLDGITDWTPIDVGLDYSGYKNCKSLTKILENRKEIELAVFKASKL